MRRQFEQCEVLMMGISEKPDASTQLVPSDTSSPTWGDFVKVMS